MLPLRIIEETPDWLVVDKPAHIRVHPSKPSDERTLWHALRETLAFELANGGQVSLIHRLDRETSGLMLIAKNAPAARKFSVLMERRVFQKRYFALVWGWPRDNEFEIDAPLLRQGDVMESRIYLKQTTHPTGVAARTTFRVLQRFTMETSNGAKFSLVEATLHTGRMHQIRVHLAHAGHAVVGDKIYGPDEGCYLEFIETGWTDALASRLLLPRHALHAGFLAVPDEHLAWESPLAEDLQKWMSNSQNVSGNYFT